MRIFWIFIIGSVFGFFAEMIYALVYTRALEIRQGLLYGPFIQIYGIGAIAYYLLVSKIQEPKKLFFSGMLMGGILEYLCSFFQEIFFGTISWDYSNLFLNFNGRTSFIYCFYWGLIGVFFLKVVYPFLLNIDKWAENKTNFENLVREKKSENEISLINNINSGIQNTISNIQQRETFDNNVRAIAAGNPNVNPRILKALGIRGITDKMIEDWDKAYGKKYNK